MYKQPNDKAMTFYASIQPQDSIHQTNRPGVYAVAVNHLAAETEGAMKTIAAVAASHRVKLFHARIGESEDGVSQVSALFVGPLNFIAHAALNMQPNLALVHNTNQYDFIAHLIDGRLEIPQLDYFEGYIEMRTRMGILPVLDLDDREGSLDAATPMRYVLDYIFPFDPGVRGETYGDMKPGIVTAPKRLFCSYVPVNPAARGHANYDAALREMVETTGCTVEWRLDSHALLSSESVMPLIDALLLSIVDGNRVRGREVLAQQVMSLMGERPIVRPIPSTT